MDSKGRPDGQYLYLPLDEVYMKTLMALPHTFMHTFLYLVMSNPFRSGRAMSAPPWLCGAVPRCLCRTAARPFALACSGP